jgi:hypothetical protein
MALSSFDLPVLFLNRHKKRLLTPFSLKIVKSQL